MSNPDFKTFLSHDHKHCDEVLGALRRAASGKDWSEADQLSERLAHDVLAHFSAEEEILFPAFETSSGMSCGPTQVMRMEHEEARALLQDLGSAVAERDADTVRGLGETLLILLQQHNLKEENILYPMAFNSLGAQAAGIGERIIARRQA